MMEFARAEGHGRAPLTHDLAHIPLHRIKVKNLLDESISFLHTLNVMLISFGI